MGLDMYLDRYERCGGATPDEIDAVQDWFSYQQRPEKYHDSTFADRCGREKPSDELIEKCKHMIRERHPAWAGTDNYTYESIHENIGYWRKANQIHKWFVDNVQDGEDDCQMHREVTKSDLESLLTTCQEVINNSRLVDGKVISGYSFNKDGQMEKDLADGKVIEDPSVAEKLLPSQGGFFFGSTEYDEWYLNDIEDTIEICKNALATTDFNTQMIYYCSSW